MCNAFELSLGQAGTVNDGVAATIGSHTQPPAAIAQEHPAGMPR
jgi:hypothetical protein